MSDDDEMIDWFGLICTELEKIGTLAKHHQDGDLDILLTEIEQVFDGDMEAAYEAIRNRQPPFEPIPDVWRVGGGRSCAKK